ncbi:hypothetical protein EXM22_15525 [Oceanispirochaeta crateris]|uniref:Uncharacterized protein n=1 Tax=Oceanispirochaeta crateris TaxID=2518645 RepID=A0A5C1QQ38_9SPIO|nr:hypothetical protein [Oceanispirochaeta crateris]QEN09319.1 hypothetical protein EXM22_15525 [Oceanispirochaeta crateris]
MVQRGRSFSSAPPPQWEPGLGLSPWGAYIPSISHQGDLDFKAGAAVSILIRILEAGANLEGFNCRRFLYEMESLDDPWRTDHEMLMRQLGRQEMRIWYIRPKTEYPVVIPLPEGRWFFPSLLHEPLDSDGGLVSLDLPEGYSCLFQPASAEIAEIQVDDHGEAVCLVRSISGSLHSMGVCPDCLR